jgi:predicted DNA-binding protein YlxM (UPF0122 family)
MPRAKDPVKEKLYTARLYAAYGPLLSDRQRKFIDLHCNEDLSLSEIAEGEGISRQAVFDAIKQGRKRLERFESVLHLGEQSEGKQSGGAAGADLDLTRVEEALGKIESLARSGAIYETRRVRELIGEAQEGLGLAKSA